MVFGIGLEDEDENENRAVIVFGSSSSLFYCTFQHFFYLNNKTKQ
jgi:hypothetical protein